MLLDERDERFEYVVCRRNKKRCLLLAETVIPAEWLRVGSPLAAHRAGVLEASRGEGPGPTDFAASL